LEYFSTIGVSLNRSKILELEEELKVVGNNMKSLEISEQEVGFGVALFAL